MEKLLSQNINRIWSSLIIDEFIKNNITQFYLSPGMRNAPLIAALVHLQKFHKELNLVLCMDERGASFRALGYSKATGKPSVLICTSGTAMANYTPAVVEAKKSNLPLIVLSADRPPELTFCDDNQTIDQTKFFGDYIQGEMNLGAPTVDISPLAMTSSLSNLINKSLFPQKGPVHFNCAFREPLEDTIVPVPTEYLKLAKIQIERFGPSTKYLNLETRPDKKAIAEIANILKNSPTGLLVVGSLAPYEGTEIVREFVKNLNWPTYFDVSSSLKYAFNLADDSIPTFDHPEVQAELVKNPPSTVFHIGGRLTSKHYYSFLKQVPEINLITLNLNIEKEDPSHHTKIRINAHIDSTLKAIMKSFDGVKLPKKSWPLNFESFSKNKIKLIDEGPLSYPSVSKTIIDSIPNESTLYIGNSTMVRTFDAYFSLTNRKDLKVATNRGVSGIEGFIASSCGLIDGIKKEVYLMVGDVSFIHDLNSLYFLKDIKTPLKIILVNNDGGGIFTLLPIHKEKTVLDYISSPHGQTFNKTAESFGIDYVRVTKREELTPALEALYKKDGHCIMEIIFDHETNKAVYDQLRTIKL
ncbi:MAG: 2-succinyl-5-enolpyruvyl-6-hydroxy-3-cyclohexene-1-carboxylic-acid synthase [Bdellovibrionales bacterium]|nr:2-succinyl-5-enolpyruvyl-6-hydroxy-3-cyclohexene-1-carboxylic-acid synthase [Bdellovibrionales bacterium]